MGRDPSGSRHRAVRTPPATGFRRALVGILAVLALVACASDRQQNVVQALWYGKNQDGTLASGITDVAIATERGEVNRAFTVDLSGMADSGTGPVWNASAWSAAAVATLETAADPRGLAIKFAVGESIDGPSAGGLMTAAVMSDLLGTRIPGDTAMTGTILPNGEIGPVGGIPEKLRGAARAGIKTVLVPAGQRNTTDPRTGKQVNVIDEGKNLGIDVREVLSVSDAYRSLTGEPLRSAIADPGPIDPALIELLDQPTRAAVDRLSSTESRVDPLPGNRLNRAHARVSRGVEFARIRVPELLGEGRSIEAFALATLTEREVLEWNSQSATYADATASPERATKARARLLNRARSLAAGAESALITAGGMPVTKVEQLAALPDALAWAADAESVAQWAQSQLTDPVTVSSPADLGQLAADLAEAEYDLGTFMPTALEAIALTGNMPAGNPGPLLDVMDEYSTFLGAAGDANMNYHAASRGSTKSASLSFYDAALATQTARMWQDRLASRTGEGSQQEIVSRLSVAIAYFVSSTSLVAGAGLIESVDPGDGFMSRVEITNQEAFEQQVDLARESSARQAEILAGAGLDSSYFRWNSEWGLLIANASQALGTTAKLRREGLQYSWYQGVEAKLSLVLKNVMDSGSNW